MPMAATTSSLESFAVRDARLAIFDEVTGLFIVAPRASLVLSRRKSTPSAPVSTPMSKCRAVPPM